MFFTCCSVFKYFNEYIIDADNKRFMFFNSTEPANYSAEKRLKWAAGQVSIHKGGQGTIPSTIGDEKLCNPFARIDVESIIKFCGNASDRAERMRLVRKGKDDWGKGIKTSI